MRRRGATKEGSAPSWKAAETSQGATDDDDTATGRIRPANLTRRREGRVRADAADRDVRFADVARPPGRCFHFRPGVDLLCGAASRRSRTVTERRKHPLPRRLLVAAQRQHVRCAVRARRPRVPGRPPPRTPDTGAAMARQGTAERGARPATHYGCA